MVCCDGILALCRALQGSDIGLSCGLIGPHRPKHLQVVGHDGIADVNGGSLRGNL